jgi:hypothetical protein
VHHDDFATGIGDAQQQKAWFVGGVIRSTTSPTRKRARSWSASGEPLTASRPRRQRLEAGALGDFSARAREGYTLVLCSTSSRLTDR